MTIRNIARCLTLVIAAAVTSSASAQVLPVQGACCLINGPIGGCIQTSFADCVERGGLFQGAGSSCAEIFCGPGGLGGCCLPSGNCVNTTADDCAAQLGAFVGVGTNCATILCIPDPVGACCFQPPPVLPVEPYCLELRFSECEAQGGEYLGSGTNCADVVCERERLGACCLQGFEGPVCAIITEVECRELNGEYFGDGTACDEVDCVITGACCISDPTGQRRCVVTTFFDCVILGLGDYQGDNTTCADVSCAPTGACCLGYHPNDPRDWAPHCVERNREECISDLGAYLGDGTNCENTVCVTGACCFPNLSTIPGQTRCAVTIDQICESLGGEYLGDGTVCTNDSCAPIGACCVQGFEERICIQATEAECREFFSSEYIGDNIDCADVQCEPTGACCVDNVPTPGGGGCIVTTFFQCFLAGGVYQGPDTVCTPTTCAPATGACCLQGFEGPVCSILTEDDCRELNGRYFGDGTLCEDVPCVITGACCFVDASGQPVCFERTLYECVIVGGGTYLGDNTVCAPDICACPCDIDGVPGVEIQDLLVYIVFWFFQNPQADFNGDGVVDIMDLLDFLSCWSNATSGNPCP